MLDQKHKSIFKCRSGQPFKGHRYYVAYSSLKSYFLYIPCKRNKRQNHEDLFASVQHTFKHQYLGDQSFPSASWSCVYQILAIYKIPTRLVQNKLSANEQANPPIPRTPSRPRHSACHGKVLFSPFLQYASITTFGKFHLSKLKFEFIGCRSSWFSVHHHDIRKFKFKKFMKN